MVHAYIYLREKYTCRGLKRLKTMRIKEVEILYTFKALSD